MTRWVGRLLVANVVVFLLQMVLPAIEVLGAFSICDASGETCKDGGRAYLCRCGASANKPFCDGTHSKIGFRG